jgi:hypothetical protein
MFVPLRLLAVGLHEVPTLGVGRHLRADAGRGPSRCRRGRGHRLAGVSGLHHRARSTRRLPASKGATGNGRTTRSRPRTIPRSTDHEDLSRLRRRRPRARVRPVRRPGQRLHPLHPRHEHHPRRAARAWPASGTPRPRHRGQGLQQPSHPHPPTSSGYRPHPSPNAPTKPPIATDAAATAADPPPSTRSSTDTATSSNAASTDSNTTAASPPDTTVRMIQCHPVLGSDPRYDRPSVP